MFHPANGGAGEVGLEELWDFYGEALWFKRWLAEAVAWGIAKAFGSEEND